MNVVVTGASKGIGYETAKLLYSLGHNVVAIARNKVLLDKLQSECESVKTAKLKTISFDLESGNYNQLASFIKTELGAVNVLINNAGSLINKPFTDFSLEELQKIYSVNVFSVFQLVKSLLPLMEKQQGPPSHILNISSMGGFQGSAKFSGLSAYSSSKGALSVLTECMAEEFKPLGISVNCLCLGAVQTEMLTQAFPGYKAPVSAAEMARFVGDFALKGQQIFNGKVLPVSLSTP